MTLPLGKWSLLVTILALLGCTTQPLVDPLEAKARDGDPVAACQLVARSLHSCALEKQKWENGQLSIRPACVDNGITKLQMAYLDKADTGLEGQQFNRIFFGVTKVELATAALLLQAGPADKAMEAIDELPQSCANLADRPKI